LHKNGNIIFVSARGRFIGSIDEGKFTVFLRDITASVKIEKKLKESEEKYKHLFQNSSYVIILLNFNGEIFNVNSTFEKIFGYSKEDFVGTNFLKYLLCLLI
jgi:PAS domain-containing protein